MPKRVLKALIAIIITLCLGNCVPGHNDFSDFKHLPPQGWRYTDVLRFLPEHTDSVANGCLTLALRHSSLYLYSNIYLEVSYEDAEGVRRADTLNVLLADRYGRWLGRGIGTDFQVVDTVNPNFAHTLGKSVNVRHIMRVDTLQGVELVGLSFKASK